MNQETLTEQVVLAQAGDAEALEQLLFYIHTPVSFLCRKLLQDETAAEEEIREILSIAADKLNTLQEPDLFEKWVLRITSARCMQLLPQLRWGSQVEAGPETLADIPERELTPEETADAVQKMMDVLPDDARTCLLLYCCSGMSSRSIAQITGYTQDAVRRNLAKGQTLLQDQLERCQNTGTTFSGITSLEALLHTAMYQNDSTEEAMPVVYAILGKKMPVPPDPGKWVVRILGTVAVILLLVFLGLCGILALKLLNIM